jgi:hypothetical protein
MYQQSPSCCPLDRDIVLAPIQIGGIGFATA